mmetsp:Transcript_21207/g.25684  ORF Transcript_21207/g.25684 Transcript_21207/m.25684 type:complete len:99 (-) Transcript_21207:93-389(-)
MSAFPIYSMYVGEFYMGYLGTLRELYRLEDSYTTYNFSNYERYTVENEKKATRSRKSRFNKMKTSKKMLTSVFWRKSPRCVAVHDNNKHMNIHNSVID